MLHRADPAFPPDLHRRVNITWRHEFFGPGYAKGTPATDTAIEKAAGASLQLEPTYTGKAMAALLADFARCARDGIPQLFWNTYNAAPLPTGGSRSVIPAEFRRYLD